MKPIKSLDLYQFHLLDFTLARAAEALDILEKLVQEGKIRFYGWSTNSPERARLFAQAGHCTAIQHHFNVIDDSAGILAVCEEYDQGSIARGPLAQGFLSGKYTAENIDTLLSQDDFRMRERQEYLVYIEKLAALREVLTSGGRSLVQGALAWLWARDARTVPIPGFRTLAQVEENIQAMQFGALNAEQMKQIDEILGRQPAITG